MKYPWLDNEIHVLNYEAGEPLISLSYFSQVFFGMVRASLNKTDKPETDCSSVANQDVSRLLRKDVAALLYETQQPDYSAEVTSVVTDLQFHANQYNFTLSTPDRFCCIRIEPGENVLFFPACHNLINDHLRLGVASSSLDPQKLTLKRRARLMRKSTEVILGLMSPKSVSV